MLRKHPIEPYVQHAFVVCAIVKTAQVAYLVSSQIKIQDKKHLLQFKERYT